MRKRLSTETEDYLEMIIETREHILAFIFFEIDCLNNNRMLYFHYHDDNIFRIWACVVDWNDWRIFLPHAHSYWTHKAVQLQYFY